MPTVEELKQREVQGYKPGNAYGGPTEFRYDPDKPGIQINQLNSPRHLARDIIRQLQRSQFASVNIVGIPGVGKSVFATYLAHMIHTDMPEFKVIWATSNELRRIKDFLENLPKGQPYIVIFDDTSNALDSLSGEELSDAFNSYTMARHETGSKICPIMIYHYTKSHKKNFRSMALFSIYLSATPSERGNIRELIRDDNRAKIRFRAFQKIFASCFGKGIFDMDLGNGTMAHYRDSDPFRPAFVLGPLGANLILFPKMGCEHCYEKPQGQKIDSDILIQKLIDVYPHEARLALGLFCYAKGHKDGISNKLRIVMDFTYKLLINYNINYDELTERLKKLRKDGKKRPYRKKGEEEILAKSIIAESKEKLKDQVISPIESPKPMMETVKEKINISEITSPIDEYEGDEYEE